MSQLGQRLREAREHQGITLAQAAVETRILQRYLVALEDGDYQHLPGDVYARGFIRNYAAYLGIPSEELIELYRRERGGTEPIRVVPATSSPRIRGLFAPSFVGVFFVVLVLIGLSYIILNTIDLEEGAQLAAAPTSTTAPPSPLPTSEPAPTTAPQVAIGSTPEATAPAATREPGPAAGGAATPPPSPSPEPSPEAPIVFEVRIQEGNNPGSWLSIEVDGRQVYQQILEPGQTLQYTAQRRVSMRVGNAGVVYVVVNNNEQGPLGGPGEVVTFTWPPQ